MFAKHSKMGSHFTSSPDQWRTLVADRLRRTGYDSTVAFLKGFPNIPFGQLYRLVCREEPRDQQLDIGFARFEDAIFFGAIKEGAVRWVTLDMLVRVLREHLGKGWDRGTDARVRRGRAYSEWRFPWRTDEDYENTSATCERIWSRLKAIAPPDWRPSGTDDPVILDAFEAEWPE